MRGDDQQTGHMFSYLSPEQRVPQDHPLRAIRTMTDAALRELSPQFDAIYAKIGRPSVPPEQLLRALLLQVLYTVRSERLLMEELHYNLLFRWFVGLEHGRRGVDADDVHQESRPAAGRRHRRARSSMPCVPQARAARLLSDEHFTVDGTLLEAWAGQKSFKPTRRRAQPPPDDPGNPTVNFHGERRRNDDARVDDRSRCAAVSEGATGQESEAGVSGPRAARQPPRPGRQICATARHRHRRARGRADPAGGERAARQHRGGRQGVRRPRASSRRARTRA